VRITLRSGNPDIIRLPLNPRINQRIFLSRRDMAAVQASAIPLRRSSNSESPHARVSPIIHLRIPWFTLIKTEIFRAQFDHVPRARRRDKATGISGCDDHMRLRECVQEIGKRFSTVDNRSGGSHQAPVPESVVRGQCIQKGGKQVSMEAAVGLESPSILSR
jgi:hypothetical protein